MVENFTISYSHIQTKTYAYVYDKLIKDLYGWKCFYHDLPNQKPQKII